MVRERLERARNELAASSSGDDTVVRDRLPVADGTATTRDEWSTVTSDDHSSFALGALAVSAIVAILWWSGGVLGLLASLPIVALWYLTPSPLSVAAGYAVFAALSPEPSSIVLALFVVASIVVLLADVVPIFFTVPVGLPLGTILSATVLGVASYGALVLTGSYSLATVTLLVLFGAIGFTLYRYGIVQRQLLEEDG